MTAPILVVNFAYRTTNYAVVDVGAKDILASGQVFGLAAPDSAEAMPSPAARLTKKTAAAAVSVDRAQPAQPTAAAPSVASGDTPARHRFFSRRRSPALPLAQAHSGEIIHRVGGDSHHHELSLVGDEAALRAIFQQLDAYGPPLETIGAVAHRVAHGADLYTQATLVTDEVIADIERLAPLAPEHNPPAAQAIRAARRLLPELPHVAVFDTAFFADLPQEATAYALPRDWLERFHLRRYGFHGTTHRYVAEQLARVFGRDDRRLITCYLGRGYSLAAIDSGRPVDTSGGFTTLEGLPMPARSGSIDPGLHRFLTEQLSLAPAEFERILYEESGLFGLTGQADPLALWQAYDAGDRWAKLAIDHLTHRLVHYISAFHGLLGGAHAIAFTGTVGETDWRLRQVVCQRLAPLGVDLDPAVNAKTQGDIRSRIVTHPHSDIQVAVVHDRDSLILARQAAAALGWGKTRPAPAGQPDSGQSAARLTPVSSPPTT